MAVISIIFLLLGLVTASHLPNLKKVEPRSNLCRFSFFGDEYCDACPDGECGEGKVCWKFGSSAFCVNKGTKHGESCPTEECEEGLKCWVADGHQNDDFIGECKEGLICQAYSPKDNVGTCVNEDE